VITNEQREARKRFLGSSDAPAVMGFDPSRTRYDVWADKAEQLVPKERKGNAAMDAGIMLEDSVLRWAEQRLGVPLVRDVNGQAGRMILHPNGFMAANLDGLILEGEPAIVEAKTSGIVGRLAWDDWGEEDSEDVPDRVVVQVAHQFAVVRAAMGLDVTTAWVPALLGGRGFVMFRLRYTPELVQAICDEEERFWREHVITKEPPADLPSAATLKALRRIPEKVVQISSELVTDWQLAKAALRAAEETKNTLERALLVTLGDAEIGEWEGGRLSYKRQIRKAYTVPEASFPVLRELKAKVQK